MNALNIENMTIGQAREIAALFGAASAPAIVGKDHGMCILAADRGWVFVGKVCEEGDNFVMTDSRTVIRWGTTKGLEELADKGPLTNTRLAESAACRMIPRAAVKFVVACNESAWAK